MVTRSNATSRTANSTVGTDEDRKNAPSPNKDQRARTAKEDKERSDWEGMNPRPEQGSDDVAAPGEVPRDPE